MRLQVTEDGYWSLHFGDSSYDQDHRGYWGASSFSGNGDLVTLAIDLLEQVSDAVASDDPAIEASYPAMEVEIEESDEAVLEDGRCMSAYEAEEKGIAHEKQCTLWADRGEAMSDQTVLGSTWETPRDMDRAYTIVSGDADSVRAQLRKEGYRTIG